MEKFKKILKLFWTMFKIGLFTFGGGYAMVAIIQRELVEKQKIIDKDEYLDILAIAESTPGPIAVNTATYVGYNVGKVLGSFFATLGVVLPSFIVVFIISFIFDWFFNLQIVSFAFKGIQACVAFLIISAGIKMFKGLKTNLLNAILFLATIIIMTLFKLFHVGFSTIYYILIGGFVGVVIYLISLAIKSKTKDKKGDGEK